MCEVKQSPKRKRAYAISFFLIFAMLISVLAGINFIPVNVIATDIYEPDDTPATASSIPVDGTLQNHDFDPTGEEDWLTFSATLDKYYIIETHNLAGGADTYLYLYETDGFTLIDEDDDDGEGWASMIAWTATGSGSYYIMCENYYASGGSYDINVTESDPPLMDIYEPDDSFGEATIIPTDGTNQTHNFHESGNQDWLKFSALMDTVYLIETHNVTVANTGIILFDSDGITIIAVDDDGGVGTASKIIWRAPRDDDFYVVAVEVNSSSGDTYTYDINISETVEPPGDMYEPDNTYTDAGSIAADGSIQNHSFHISGDEDWLTFSATLDTMYAIETFNLSITDTYIYLYDSDGTTILDEDDSGGVGDGSYIFWTAPRDDTFYIKVTDQWGSGGPDSTYEINITETQAPTGDIYEPDNIPGEAKPILTDGTMQSHDFHISGDEDWVNFTAVLGTMYIIETHNLGSSDTEITLYDTDGTTFLDDDDDSGMGSASRLEWTAPGNGNYYVCIEEFFDESGPGYTYDVNISTYGIPGGDAFEPDNNYVDANAISQDGAPQSHNFHFSGDVDWIRIATMAGWTYIIETHNLSDADTEIFLYDHDGTTQVDYDDDGGGGHKSKIVWTAPENEVIYLRVREVDEEWGPTYTYDISVTETQYLPEPPEVPTNLIAQAGDSYVHLSWDAPSSPGSSPITNYVIYRNTTTGPKEVLIEIGNQTYYNDTGVTNFITYYYNISAKSQDGGGNLSDEISAAPFILPTAPTSLEAESGDSYVLLTWNAPTSDGGSPITNYTIYREAWFGFKTLVATVEDATSYNDTDVSAGVTYYYTIGACNSCGEGALSDEVSAKLISTPSSPTNVEANYGNSFIELSWTSPLNTGGAPITNYRIYKGMDIGEESFLVEIGNITSYNDTDVTNGVTYYYQIAAKNSIGEGAHSWEIISAKPATLPGAPTDITVASATLLGVSVISVSWTAPESDGGAAITNYKIYRGTKKGEETFYDNAGVLTVYYDSEIKTGQKYYYKVVAENEMGDGVSSAEASITPKETDATPLLLCLGIGAVIIIVIVVLVVLLIVKKKGKQAEVEPQVGFEGAAWDQAPQTPPGEQMQPVVPMVPSTAPLPPPPQTPGQYPPPPQQPRQKPIQPHKSQVITYNCPHCQKPFTAESPAQALVVACPSCGGHTTIGPS